MNEIAQNQTFRFSEPIGPNGGKVEAIGPGGKRFQLTLTPSDVHTTSELSTYLAGYKPFAFRAEDASPIVQVDKTKFYYRTFDSDDAFLHVNTKVGLTSPPVNVDPGSSVLEGYTENHSVGSLVSVQTEEQADSFSPKAVAGKRCMNAILIDREKEVFDLVGTAANWDASVRHTLGGAENWDGGADSDPIQNLQDAIEASMQEVTAILFNRKVSNTFLRHAATVAYMRQWYGDEAPQKAGRASDYTLPGFPPFKVINSKYRNTPGGLRINFHGNNVVLLCQPPSPPTDGEEISSCYTYREKGEDAVGINIREWFVDGAGTKGATMVNVTLAEKTIMTGNTCGGHIASVIS
ncbi:MAG: hypothetical protein GY854_02310 [Deltaproteobacteria bacterium]|nr:hypothetical protein [Deltaproteobacteria bacterium]